MRKGRSDMIGQGWMDANSNNSPMSGRRVKDKINEMFVESEQCPFFEPGRFHNVVGRYRPSHPAWPPRMRFLFVRPAHFKPFGFLQIPPRDGHPCRSANSSPCRACGGLSPPSGRALPGAPKKGGGSKSASLGIPRAVKRQNASGDMFMF